MQWAGSGCGHVTRSAGGHAARRHYKFNQRAAPAAGSRLIVCPVSAGPSERRRGDIVRHAAHRSIQRIRRLAPVCTPHVTTSYTSLPPQTASRSVHPFLYSSPLLQHKNQFTVFTSWRQSAPRNTSSRPNHSAPSPKQHLDRFIRFCTAPHRCRARINSSYSPGGAADAHPPSSTRFPGSGSESNVGAEQMSIIGPAGLDTRRHEIGLRTSTYSTYSR